MTLLTFRMRLVTLLVLCLAVAGSVGLAEAARTTLTPITPVGPHPSLPVAANSLDLAWTAADTVNFNQFQIQGPVTILVRNVHATTAFTFTLTSAPDSRKRTGDVGPFTLQAGEVAAFYVNNMEGWQQTDGFFYLQGNDASVQFCIVRIP